MNPSIGHKEFISKIKILNNNTMLPVIFLKKLESNLPFVLKNQFSKLVSWSSLEALINLRPFMSDSRVRVLGNESYNWQGSEWTTDPDTFPATCLETELKKYVFYIRDCSRINQQVNDICAELETILDTPIDVHLYFSLINDISQTKHGFGIHRDKIDVIIIQSEGVSRFKLWEPTCVPENSNPTIDHILESGSVVFIPAGYWHEIISETKRISLSFAFGTKGGQREDRHWVSLDQF